MPILGNEFVGSIYAPDPFPYTYNLFLGAQRWRNAASRIRDIQPAGSVSQYGVDILWCGDSTTTYGDIIESVPHFVKVILQEALNRPGVAGGFGFFPFNTQSSTSNDWTLVNGSGVWDTSHNNSGRVGTGLYEAKINPASANNKIWRYFDPTTAAGVFWRAGVTDWEYVGLSFTGGVPAGAVYCDSATTNGALTPSNLVTMAATNAWGEHWTKQTGLDPNKPHTIQIASHEATDQTWANGVILYNGDYNEGVRMHALSSVGSDTGNWWNSGNAQHLQANFDQFCTGANGGARNCKLIIFPLMLNDCGITSANITPAVFQANLQSLISYVTGLASKPCVCLMTCQPWDLAASNTTQLALYPQYTAAMYALANANPSTVFVMDVWKSLCDTPNTFFFKVSGVTTSPTVGATYTNNGVTYTVVGTNTGTFAKTVVAATGATAPSASGTLTKVSGTGDATIAFSGYVPPSPNGYANYGPQCAGGAVNDSLGGYNDGTHLLGSGNHTRANMVAAALLWGIGFGGSGPLNQVLSVTGAGTAYSLSQALTTVTFGTTSPTLVLPPGTWQVIGSVKFTGATAADDLQAQLYNSSDSAAIGGLHDVSAGTTGFVEISLLETFTLAASKTITFQAQNVTGVRGTIVAAGTYLRAVKVA